MIDNKNTYILSVEGSDLYSHMIRNKPLKKNYCGMLPFSLELIKLKKVGLKAKFIKYSGKEISDDVINVKFNQKVRNGEYIIGKIQDKVNETEIKINKYQIDLEKAEKEIDKNKIQDKIDKINEYKKKLKEFIKTIQNEINEDKWNELANDKLREYLYEHGFTVTDVDEKTGEATKTTYVVYKRSSSKSRTGQCLFIREDLYDEMIKWSRMYLNFPENWEGDYPGLLAYTSLVGSALEDTIIINPHNILIVDDVESVFKWDVNVVKMPKKNKEENQYLDSFREKNYKVKNSLFDGESLLDDNLIFGKAPNNNMHWVNGKYPDKSMLLLRNHMFKSAAFCCNIQKFLMEHCPEGTNYDEWKIKNMFGDEMYAKNVHMLITPTSLKALKFSDILGSKRDMWEHWKTLIEKEDCVFGVCKFEKQSKRGIDWDGNILQQTSYQMINSMPLKEDDIKQLTTFEKEYIMRLKNDDDFFVQYIEQTANKVNSNLMFAGLAKHNKNFMGTELFRDFRAKEIHKYVTHVKKGKVRLLGDYCVLLGNPVEYLYHAIGVGILSEKYNLLLRENEIYTKLFDDGEELICFRNPHTSPSNVFIGRNKQIDEIDKYFNLSSNIVCVNAVKFPIQDMLSSADYDSDSMAIFKSDTLKNAAHECFGKFNVCINGVKSDLKKYTISNKSMAEIDNQLATSQKNIGTVVNIGQLVMSTYWDKINKGNCKEDLLELLKKVDVSTILSCICIDQAKKFYDLDLENEIKNIKKTKGLEKTKPVFFKYVSQSDTIGKRIKKYDCPMDYLNNEMNKLPSGNDKGNIEFKDLLIRSKKDKANKRQKREILLYVKEMCDKIKCLEAKYNGDSDDVIEEKNNSEEDVIKYYNYYISKKTVKPDTMYSLLKKLDETEDKTKLLNVLYTTQKETFLKAFKKCTPNTDKN